MDRIRNLFRAPCKPPEITQHERRLSRLFGQLNIDRAIRTNQEIALRQFEGYFQSGIFYVMSHDDWRENVVATRARLISEGTFTQPQIDRLLTVQVIWLRSVLGYLDNRQGAEVRINTLIAHYGDHVRDHPAPAGLQKAFIQYALICLGAPGRLKVLKWTTDCRNLEYLRNEFEVFETMDIMDLCRYLTPPAAFAQINLWRLPRLSDRQLTDFRTALTGYRNLMYPDNDYATTEYTSGLGEHTSLSQEFYRLLNLPVSPEDALRGQQELMNGLPPPRQQEQQRQQELMNGLPPPRQQEQQRQQGRQGQQSLLSYDQQPGRYHAQRYENRAARLTRDLPIQQARPRITMTGSRRINLELHDPLTQQDVIATLALTQQALLDGDLPSYAIRGQQGIDAGGVTKRIIHDLTTFFKRKLFQPAAAQQSRGQQSGQPWACQPKPNMYTLWFTDPCLRTMPDLLATLIHLAIMTGNKLDLPLTLGTRMLLLYGDSPKLDDVYYNLAIYERQDHQSYLALRNLVIMPDEQVSEYLPMYAQYPQNADIRQQASTANRMRWLNAVLKKRLYFPSGDPAQRDFVLAIHQQLKAVLTRAQLRYVYNLFEIDLSGLQVVGDYVEGKAWLTQWISEADQNQLRMLTIFVHGTVSNRKIGVQHSNVGIDALPVSHTCAGLLDIPLYPDYRTFKQKLEYAIANTDSAMFLA